VHLDGKAGSFERDSIEESCENGLLSESECWGDDGHKEMPLCFDRPHRLLFLKTSVGSCQQSWIGGSVTSRHFKPLFLESRAV
jgi:hypothetical protein